MFKEILFKENDMRIMFSVDLLKRMRQYLQLQNDAVESGGILLGFVCKDSHDLLVTEMTVPYEDDVSNRNNFVRQSREHIKVYERLYASSSKTCLYVGEWHTHPETFPLYSKVDECNWRLISMADNAFPMQVHVIAGRGNVSFWAFCKDLTPILLNAPSWDEVECFCGD